MKMNSLLSKIVENDLEEKILEINLVQRLWKNYGGLYRVKTHKKNYIIKLIQKSISEITFSNQASQYAHLRKVKSYQVETSFYKNYKEHQPYARTANFITANQTRNLSYIVLEDLSSIGYVMRKKLNLSEIQKCIEWLAQFHMCYLYNKIENLWPTGTYWHLETRPFEYEALQNNDGLKEYAHIVDQELQQCPYQTIVHGDAKSQNFLFLDHNKLDGKNKVCAVDFQYVGGGVGIKDVVYFLSSVFNESELYQHENGILDLYFKKLSTLGCNSELIQSWRKLYSYAWFDYYRFLAGSSPQHYKINHYIKNQTQKVIDAIRSQST